ncbi:hypothetical protein JCM17844_04860 [Iodidimonas gelatinilytica]|uniref:CvpA family protein n=2 Tax=Iodidimonas gelatinilytica TaxID=1236966 RepID=A0A5A7MPU7_9PROT|nr:hypothetical protein JCM17844_04860 [Iodidimonas gelatinilytica]
MLIDTAGKTMSESLTAFDVIVLLFVGGTVLYAVFRGFTTMLLTVAAWFGAVLITLYGMPYASGFARDWITPATLADFIALPLLFIVSLVLLKLIAGFIGSKVRSGPAGFLDRSLGAALGLFLGAVLVSATYLFFSSVVGEKRYPQWVQEARLKPLVAYGASMLAKTGPDIFRAVKDDPTGDALLDQMRESYDQSKDRLRDAAEPAYEEAQRRLMNQKFEELLKTKEQNEEDGGD